MRLSDLRKVHDLEAERAYLKTLLAGLGPFTKMRIGDHDLKPELKKAIVEPMTNAFRAEAARIEAALADLGVTVDNPIGRALCADTMQAAPRGSNRGT